MKRLATISFVAWAALMLPLPIHAQSTVPGMGLHSGIYQGRNPHRYCDELSSEVRRDLAL